jgi:hypothetical protein
MDIQVLALIYLYLFSSLRLYKELGKHSIIFKIWIFMQVVKNLKIEGCSRTHYAMCSEGNYKNQSLKPLVLLGYMCLCKRFTFGEFYTLSLPLLSLYIHEFSCIYFQE